MKRCLLLAATGLTLAPSLAAAVRSDVGVGAGGGTPGTSLSFTLVGHNPLFDRGMNAAPAIFDHFVYIGNRSDGSNSCGDADPGPVWGAKTRCAPREIGDLQAGRYFWHPTGIRGEPAPKGHDVGARDEDNRGRTPSSASRSAAAKPSTSGSLTSSSTICGRSLAAASSAKNLLGFAATSQPPAWSSA